MMKRKYTRTKGKRRLLLVAVVFAALGMAMPAVASAVGNADQASSDTQNQSGTANIQHETKSAQQATSNDNQGGSSISNRDQPIDLGTYKLAPYNTGLNDQPDLRKCISIQTHNGQGDDAKDAYVSGNWKVNEQDSSHLRVWRAQNDTLKVQVKKEMYRNTVLQVLLRCPIIHLIFNQAVRRNQHNLLI
ncbi:hypothetical protein OZX74_06780 [Bifidobacterium sp. ESL0798]|uniref:hypothetical protein n=1 Tax=Bifidobacterium sp. ESL0798 TaxID=2983235 RepID=UPI0023F6591B|nr:hypothetical protein [Bifidobacterium sp. ESL0798]WEV73616.1 hypothetical protein OZX74_06780 [Bifidobacterium sp. ESL0798]